MAVQRIRDIFIRLVFYWWRRERSLKQTRETRTEWRNGRQDEGRKVETRQTWKASRAFLSMSLSSDISSQVNRETRIF